MLFWHSCRLARPNFVVVALSSSPLGKRDAEAESLTRTSRLVRIDVESFPFNWRKSSGDVESVVPRPLAVTSRSGGIGRRAWFRSMYPQGCGGSSPFFGTILLVLNDLPLWCPVWCPKLQTWCLRG